MSKNNDPEKVVREIKRQTRRKFSAEEKIRIVLEGLRGDLSIAELCRRGWADQMVLSHDASCFIDWFPKQLVEQAAPDWNYRQVCEVVIPALRESGVSDEQIREMTVDNPRRIFEQRGAY